MKQILLGITFIFFSIAARPQYENVMISDVFNPKEPAIIMDLNQEDFIMVAANLNSYFISLDTGLTWTQSQLISDLGVYGDPVVVVDGESNFYYLHLSNPYEFYPDGDTLDRIVCQRSINNGNSWSNGSYFGLDPDKDNSKEWAVVDFSNDNIYATWTQYDDLGSDNPLDSSHILFVKSLDAGLSWSEPIRLNKMGGNSADGDSTVKGAVPAIGPNGEIYVAWAGPQGIVFDRSLDEGETWLEEDIFVDSMPGGWDFSVSGLDRCNGLPITKCDLSGGPDHGTIYINWSDQRNGEEDTDIWLSKSTDGGDSWSPAIRVNDDEAGKQQFLTWMDIDQTNGHLFFVFYDRRDQEGDDTDVYMARSTDGGESFSNMLLSETSFLPNDTLEFGDYTNIVANDGVVRPVWARMDNDEFSIWTALVDFSIWSEVKTHESLLFGIESYPNPAKEYLTIAFQLKKSAQLSLKILDPAGRLLASPFTSLNFGEGRNEYIVDLSKQSLSSGQYYYQLQVDDDFITRKFLIE
jgi:hypothetical protein